MLSSRLLSAAIRVVTSSCWIDCRRVAPGELGLIAASGAVLLQRPAAEPPQLP